MAELICLIVGLLFGFACGYGARSHISRRRRAAERKHQRKDGHLSNPSTTHDEVVRLYQKLN